MEPEHAHRLLAALWVVAEELNWFLGAPPADFGEWTAREVGTYLTFVRPDGAPGFSFPKGELVPLIERVQDRLMGRMASHQPPRLWLRGRIPEVHRAAFDERVTREPWKTAEDRALFFFITMGRRAAADPALAEEVETLYADYKSRGFLRASEWVCRNYLDVWLCERFRTALAKGGVGWQNRTRLQRYAPAVALLTEPDAPLSPQLKAGLLAERDSLQEQMRRERDANAHYLKRQAELQKEIETRVGGPILPKESTGTIKKRKPWPYFSREIFNLVSHFVSYGETEGRSCGLAGRTLATMTEWLYGEELAKARERPALLQERARRRYLELRKSGAEPRPIPLLPRTPVWLTMQSVPVPD